MKSQDTGNPRPWTVQLPNVDEVMLQQRRKQPVFVLCTLVLTIIFSTLFYRASRETTGYEPAYLEHEDAEFQDVAYSLDTGLNIYNDQPSQAKSYTQDGGDVKSEGSVKTDSNTEEDPLEYREVFSATTWDRKYVPVFYQGANVINPSILPHPTDYFLWILVSQRKPKGVEEPVAEQIGCVATFLDGALFCTTGYTPLPVQSPMNGSCTGDYADLNSYSGPRNARVFYGPDAPYIMYSSLSQHGCIGVWIQDARTLIGPLFFQSVAGPQLYFNPTEIQTPYARKPVEENFFLFWDMEGRAYVHHALFPQRIFAQLQSDGSVGEDLGLRTTMSDQMCFAKYLPAIGSPEAVQQATSSLSVTLCKRDDPACAPNDSNTFIMHLFNVESMSAERTNYEPYAVLFQRSAPFTVHAISQKPLWVHGRKVLDAADLSNVKTEAIYITSMTWKLHTQKYHGYIDDLLFLGFGIEESHPGALDITAGELLQDLAFC